MIQGGDFERGDGTGGYAADWYGYCNGQAMDNELDCGGGRTFTQFLTRLTMDYYTIPAPFPWPKPVNLILEEANSF